MRLTLVMSIMVVVILAAAAPKPHGQRNGAKIPIAKRSRLLRDDQMVDIDALKRHVQSVESKIQRGFANFERRTGKRHPSALTEVTKRGYPDAVTYDNEVYYGVIMIGNPLQFYTVQFDSASSDILLPSATCDSSCQGHFAYNSTYSSTSQDLGKTFDLDHGNGRAASGEQYTDNVNVQIYLATAQTLGAATHYSAGFQSPQFPADGVMGIAFDTISSYEASSVFQTLVSQGQLPEPILSFKLAHSGGELYVGGSNTDLYTGGFSYAPVTTQGFWEVTMQSVTSNLNDGKTILSNIDCVIDTSAYLIIGTPSDVSTLYNALGGKPATSTYGEGYYTFPCDSFPVIYFTFGGSPFPIPASALNFGPVSAGSSDCICGIVGQSAGSFWIIGDVFLRNVYTAFDLGNSRVGFAQLV